MKTFLIALALLMPTTALAEDLLDKSCLVIGVFLQDPELFAEPVANYYGAALDGLTAGVAGDVDPTREFALIDAMIDACEADMNRTIREAMSAAREQG
ncbi:hypothetical protein [Tropicimonas sp. S265A]|uniref:hypothetical protein n=1 Tax=Tropicimonas sp. S265A TaxID=3415134 RepID=UPI003C7DE78F